MKKKVIFTLFALCISALFLAACCGICSGKKCSSAAQKAVAASPKHFPVTSDGDLISGFVTTSGAWAKYKTTVSTFCDKEKLAFQFKCFTEPGKKMKYGGKKNDDMAIFNGENVEIFLCTEPATGKYFQFAINPDGYMYSARGKDFSWEPENVKVKTEKKNGFWTVDITIPFKSLDLPEAPAKGTIWNVNFCRTYYLDGYREPSNFAGISSYHDTNQFGKMIFDKKDSQSRIAIESFQYFPGKVKTSFSLKNVKEPVTIEIARGDFVHRTSNLPSSGLIEISAELPSSYIPLKDMEPVYILAKNSVTNQGIFSRKLNVAMEEKDMLLPDKFYYTAKDKKISFIIDHPRERKNDAVQVILKDMDGKILRKGVFQKKGSFTSAGLKDGSYILSASCSGGRTERLIIFNEKAITPVPLKKGAALALKDGAVTSGGEYVYLVTGSSTGKPHPAGKFFNFRAGNFGNMPHSAQLAGTPGKKLVRNPKTAYSYPDLKKYYDMMDKYFARANPASPTFHRFTYEAQIPTFLPGKNNKGFREVDSAKFHADLYKHFKAKYPKLLFCLQTDSPEWVKRFVNSCDIMEVCPAGGYANATIEHLKYGIPNAVKALNGKPRIFWTGVTIPNNRCRNAEELRAAIYLHIIYGSSGTIMHMGHGRLPLERSRLWSVIKNIAGEVASFYPGYRSMPVIETEKAIRIRADKEFKASVRGNGKKAIALVVSLSSSENQIELETVNGWKVVSGGKTGKKESWTPYEVRVYHLTK